MTTPPACPLHGPMKLAHITQGEGKDEIDLGYLWWCINDECDECEDYTPEPVQLEMEL